MKIKDASGNAQTIETLVTYFEEKGLSNLRSLLFMYYYNECIRPVMSLDLNTLSGSQENVLHNYSQLLQTIIAILYRRKLLTRNCNLFTTNYDGCIEHCADQLLKKRDLSFVVNDGCEGFIRRQLHIRNFNNQVYQTGVFDQHKSDLPQVNILHLHGSKFWKRDDQDICVNYANQVSEIAVNSSHRNELVKLRQIVEDDTKTIADLEQATFAELDFKEFWTSYNSLPIVNPSKWKFHETIFQEHYYQMLRFLSYELEKSNSILITFGFSFSDEHIRNLIIRSISNPSLQVFICCFNSSEKDRISSYFGKFKNIKTIVAEKNLDFSLFNDSIFSLNPKEI